MICRGLQLTSLRLALVVVVVGSGGCQQMIVDQADRQVYDLIDTRQRGSVGTTTDVRIGDPIESDRSHRGAMYSFNPHPVGAGVPVEMRGPAELEWPGAETEHGGSDDSIQELEAPESPPDARANAEGDSMKDPVAPTAVQGGSQGGDAQDSDSPSEEAAGELDGDDGTAQLSEDIYAPDERARATVFGLPDAINYAIRNGRDLQSAKEDLYRAALDLTLERHLWTPQFVAEVRSTFTDFEREADLDQTMEYIADLSVTQRLPFGGDITARVVDTLVRDVNEHATLGESGQAILEADIPLLRGAGRVAYESRYAAERELVYAVRIYERFRREFIVSIATDYFTLQELRAAISNTFASYKSRYEAWERADFIDQKGQSRTIFDAPRAKSILRQAEASLVSAKENYAFALDRFKVRVGMPVDEPLDVVDQALDDYAAQLDLLLPQVREVDAIRVAYKYRLDLLNRADAIDDARRGVVNARNAILPDLDLTGDVTGNSNPDHLSTTTYGSERTAWRAGLTLRMDDRKAERNAFRASLINERRAERDFEQFRDDVSTEVRRALRRVAQQEKLRAIQSLNVEENEQRLEAARAQFYLGKTTNQDVVDAETDLLDARNDLARAISQYRVAILELRLQTGTLRVGDDGRWNFDSPIDPSIAP